MGSNKFLNGDGEVDLTELLNEINALSEEVEGKLDRDGSDGGMTGNLDINNNAILLGGVGLIDSIGGNTNIVQSDAGGVLNLLSNSDVILAAPSGEIKMNDNLNMIGNNINNCNNIDLVTINSQPYPPNNVPVKKAVGLEYQTAYTFNVYSDMVNVWSGSPDVPAGSLDIGDTIELTTQFNLDPSLIGGLVSFAGNFRISFAGVVLGAVDNLILSSPQSRVGELKLSITRVDTALIQVNVVGYYNNTSFVRQSILPTAGALSYPYDENVSNTIQIEWRPSVGNVAEYMTCNLQNTKIIQY